MASPTAQIKAKLLEKYGEAKKSEIDASILYVEKKIGEKKKDRATGKYVTAYYFDAGWLLQSIAECIDRGFSMDGINYVITGNKMYMPTYHAFKNKLYETYPDSEIDVQLIREGDEYKFAKESGAVIYTHNIADPFTATEPKITGAYCVIKNKRGEFLETLNLTDYNKMKEGSKSQQTWNKWASEFWKKSVIKRACKTHFNDITEEIDKQDNDAVGLKELVSASDDKKQSIIDTKKKNNADNNTDS